MICSGSFLVGFVSGSERSLALTKVSLAVVLDPTVAFGKPIVTDGSVRPSILYDAFLREEDKHFVAKLYEVPLASVNAAVAFEQSLAA